MPPICYERIPFQESLGHTHSMQYNTGGNDLRWFNPVDSEVAKNVKIILVESLIVFSKVF